MARAIPMTPDDRRAQLLVSARTVFASLGYHRASVSDIITEAGVARGTFYNYFESKRACFQAVLSEMMNSVSAAVHPIDVTRDIPVQVRENLERLFQALTANDEVPRVLFAEAAGIDEEGDQGLRGRRGPHGARPFGAWNDPRARLSSLAVRRRAGCSGGGRSHGECDARRRPAALEPTRRPRLDVGTGCTIR